MADIVYPWNPFRLNSNNRITLETIKVDSTDKRMEFAPRAAPFFSRGFELYKQGSDTPLVLGVDYAFAHPFDKFVIDYKLNCFGSVVLLKKTDDVLLASYDNIGGPFTLDEAAFAEYVANLVNAPRTALWTDLVDVPTEWPADPHEHPVTQTYDYLEMMTALRSLITVTTGVEGEVTVRKLLEEHLSKPLVEAHQASKVDFALDQVQNMPPGTTPDLAGSSSNKSVTIALLKEAFRQYAAGNLDLN